VRQRCVPIRTWLKGPPPSETERAGGHVAHHQHHHGGLHRADQVHPTATQIYAGTTANLVEVGASSVNLLLQSTYEATGSDGVTYKGLVGTTLKTRFGEYTRVQAANSNAAMSIRTYTQADMSKIVWGVDRFEGDFGKIDLINTVYNGLTSTAGKWVGSTASKCRGYFLQPSSGNCAGSRCPRSHHFQTTVRRAVHVDCILLLSATTREPTSL